MDDHARKDHAFHALQRCMSCFVMLQDCVGQLASACLAAPPPPHVPADFNLSKILHEACPGSGAATSAGGGANNPMWLVGGLQLCTWRLSAEGLLLIAPPAGHMAASLQRPATTGHLDCLRASPAAGS